MTDGLKPVGVELVAEGAPAFTSALARGTKALNVFEQANKAAAASVNLLGQIGIGALREIGALGVRALTQAGRAAFNFATDLAAAALENTALSKTVDTLYNSLVDVTRVTFTPLSDQINQVATKAAPAFLGIVQRAEEYLSGIATDALGYGENIGNSLAQGIYNAAAAVIDALIYIGNIITGWLQPGSPPKLLPDLDDWGREAANVYLQGWTEADFSIFNAIGKEIESLLRSQAPRNDTSLIPRILGTREAIAQAIQQARELGHVTTQALDNIYQAAGATTPQVKDYLRSVFDLDLANSKLAAAQAVLNAETAKYEKLLQPINDQLAGITEAQQQLTDEQEIGRLQLTLRDPGALASEKRQAQLRIEQILAEQKRRALLVEQKAVVDGAQAAVDAAQTQVDAAQAEFDTRRQAIELITEQNNLFREQDDLLDRLAQAGAKAAGAVANAAKGKGPGGAVIKPDTTWIDTLVTKIQTKLEELKTAWSTAWALIQEKLKPVRDFIETRVIPLLKTLWNILSVEGGKSVQIIIDWWNDEMLPVFKDFWEWCQIHIIPLFQSMWNWLEENLPGAVQTLADIWNNTLLPALLSFTTWWIETGIHNWESVYEWLETNIPSAIATTVTAINTITGAINGAIQGWKDLVTLMNGGLPASYGQLPGGQQYGPTAPPQLPGLPPGTTVPPLNLPTPPVYGPTAPPVSPPSSNPWFPQFNNSGNTTTNYIYSPSYNSAPPSPQADFTVMQVWAR